MATARTLGLGFAPANGEWTGLERRMIDPLDRTPAAGAALADPKPAPDPFSIGVVIPARNAEATIEATLDSLLAQTHAAWRAIIIDDGSTDRTREVAQAYAARDPRFTVVEGPARGVSAARNLGISLVEEPWLMFLDSDDTILPEMMGRLIGRLRDAPAADAAHCAWTYTDWDGAVIGTSRCEVDDVDLFPILSTYCVFAIHTCIVRTSIVTAVGGFDESLRTSEDFDLWQKIARTGARFLKVSDELSIYRMRRQASWFDPAPFAADALKVVRRGHAADPRLPQDLVAAEHAGGAPAENLPHAELGIVLYASAIAAARGADARPLLDLVDRGKIQYVEPAAVADALRKAVPLVHCLPRTAWPQLWPEVEPTVTAFCEAIEERFNLPRFAAKARNEIEKSVIAEMAAALPLEERKTRIIHMGANAALYVEVTEPLHDLPAPGVERMVCAVHCQGKLMGELALPVCGGAVSAAGLSDAIAQNFAWALLEASLSRSVYPGLERVKEGGGWTIKRGGATLAADVGAPEGGELHSRIGWTVMAQEVLGLPDWTLEKINNPQAQPSGDAGLRRPAARMNFVELTEPIPTLTGASGEVEVMGTIGGAPLVLTRLAVQGGEVAGSAIRAALLDRAKFELLLLTVREGVLGWALDDPTPLHQRLRQRAQARRNREPPAFELIAGSLEPEAAALFARYFGSIASAGEGSLIVVGGPPHVLPGTPAARRCDLPPEALDDILSSLAPGQPAMRLGQGPARRAIYLPEFRAHEEASPSKPWADLKAYFEDLFQQEDPWNYTSPYEQTKYEQTLDAIPRKTYARALEVGCAEGHFTAQLAPRVKSLVAADISPTALARAAVRCKGAGEVSFLQLDLTKDEPPGGFDLIVCSEVLYYMGDRDGLKAATRKLIEALAPGGLLVAAHANLVADAPNECGFDWDLPYGAKVIGETFASSGKLVFQSEVRTPLYRIQVFRRKTLFDKVAGKLHRSAPAIVQARLGQLDEDVERYVLWEGRPARDESITTSRLPILMYHRVAPAGPEPLDQWRLTPEAFDEQLAYLKAEGYETVSFAEWRAARRASTPLPGKRVLITFDDGFADFEEYALPVLQKHGFSATIFMPTDLIGHAAIWDSWAGEPLKLMDWDAARRLQAAGIEFGSHAASHPRLTEVSPAQVVAEAYRSRGALQRELGIVADSIAYPFGDFDPAVVRLTAAASYGHAVTTRDCRSNLDEGDLVLSRVEVSGLQPMSRFIANLNA